MSSIEKLKTDRACVRWAKLDSSNESYLHEPKRYGDVGWDLEAAETTVIRPGEAVDVPTNVRIQLPSDIWAEIRARSSIARRGLQVDAGTIDPGYRGPLYALVRNMHVPHPHNTHYDWEQAVIEIKQGERIAQLVFRKVTPVWIQEVEEIDINTERGEGGFGSTGG